MLLSAAAVKWPRSLFVNVNVVYFVVFIKTPPYLCCTIINDMQIKINARIFSIGDPSGMTSVKRSHLDQSFVKCLTIKTDDGEKYQLSVDRQTTAAQICSEFNLGDYCEFTFLIKSKIWSGKVITYLGLHSFVVLAKHGEFIPVGQLADAYNDDLLQPARVR